ncbi:putative inner membrane protein [Hafnia paralvei ATCC 29927]|uniref:DUF421 domain-containing protein n=1 Tax=Hafnia TaxID=568 RepID=UPI0007E339FB|nr:DUF421 domain-containing protein [Hafnia paralvei]MDU1190489.1 DUF421 domain-containing protein [Enterobacteriaceae bacterium]MBU2672195.1 DUF421 domain-containing protein [Hafnia paralvei]MCE9904965.1 DUF421 domain-containing protein [Hafnia paralvei]MCE9922747.1 DUF421 domain-containing protein [Hafnia paralvei]MCE9946880.1 DUF421 domain-containing protein [Hafnia paralvei]
MQSFDLKRMAFDKAPPDFLAEVAVRCLFTFLLVFLFLKMTGRRGVRQMSLFEVIVILTLGSAAGDVAFYDDVPMLPVLTVFICIMLLYRLSTLLMSKSEKIQTWMEGKPLVIISDGTLVWDTIKRENITHDEFFMELRLEGVEHLGQVRLAILEVNGAISVYFFDEESVRYGLPVLPNTCITKLNKICEPGKYACSECSLIEHQMEISQPTCSRCGNHSWVKAYNNRRVN